MPKPRNAMAVVARRMRAVKFDHKTAPRGGDRNEMADLLEEYDSQDPFELEYDCE